MGGDSRNDIWLLVICCGWIRWFQQSLHGQAQQRLLRRCQGPPGEQAPLPRLQAGAGGPLPRPPSQRRPSHLIGYCDHQTAQGALIFEYMPNGTLHEKLQPGGGGSGGEAPLLPWSRRMRIAYELACAVDHLHESCGLPIVHNDIKPSNIHLSSLNCKLCHFGSAKMGFSSTVMPNSSPNRHLVVGSPGYVDPHYLRTGILWKKSDVYSYGVVVLELVTGMDCAKEEKMLTMVTASLLLGDKWRVAEIVDPWLEVDAQEAMEMVALAAKCIGEQPSLRPYHGGEGFIFDLSLRISEM